MVYDILVAIVPKCSLWTECEFLKLLDPLYIKIGLLILFTYSLSLLIFVSLNYQMLIGLSNTGTLAWQWLPRIHMVFNANDPLTPTTWSGLASLNPLHVSCSSLAHIILLRQGPAPLLAGSAQKSEKDRLKVSTGPEARGFR